ncbi:MAG: glycerate kinase type-2 family protein [Thermodesulfobacteriota bacterium]
MSTRTPHTDQSLRTDARSIFDAGVEAVDAKQSIYRHCRMSGPEMVVGRHRFTLSDYDNIFVIGAGKATARMAAAMETLLHSRITGGVLSVKYGHIEPLDHVDLIEAGHPVPDDAGRKAAEAILSLAGSAGPKDLVICLLSGGGSALMPLPADLVTMEEKQETIRKLLACGAAIDEINAIRKHISAIKGGQLARAAHPATILTLILSDVVGDRLDVIASGPTVADSSTFADCRRILTTYKLSEQLPARVIDRIEKGAALHLPETPDARDPAFANTVNQIVGSNVEALSAARTMAESLGYTTLILSSMIEGDTRAAARFIAAVGKEIRKNGNPVAPPACILSGGETTVVVTGSGKGGRNQEFALASAFEIAELEKIVVISGGTDGTDGPTDAAGAAVDGATLRRADRMGLAPRAYLANNDAYHFFRQTGELLITGPTGTNVMDQRVMLVG